MSSFQLTNIFQRGGIPPTRIVIALAWYMVVISSNLGTWDVDEILHEIDCKISMNSRLWSHSQQPKQFDTSSPYFLQQNPESSSLYKSLKNPSVLQDLCSTFHLIFPCFSSMSQWIGRKIYRNFPTFHGKIYGFPADFPAELIHFRVSWPSKSDRSSWASQQPPTAFRLPKPLCPGAEQQLVKHGMIIW